MSTRNRRLAALVATLTLLLASCGTRLDHEEIVRAAAGSGAGSGIGDGFGGAEDGTPLGEDGVALGAPGGDADPGQPGAGKPGSGGQSRRPDAGTNGTSGTPGKGTNGGQSGGPPIVIGNIGTYSGGSSDPWGPGARAVQAWAADINAKGGLKGRQVKVIVMDDQMNPGRARSQMKSMVEEHKIVAVVGAMTNDEQLNAWRGYVEEKGVPVIGGSCQPAWEGSPVLFRQCPSTRTVVFGTAKLGAKHGKGNKLGGLFCTESDACSAVEKQLFDDGDAKRAGLDPRYRGRISVFGTDYTSECIQARNSGVELLLVAADAGTVARVASSCRRQNYTPQFLELSSTVQLDTVTKPGLNDVLVGMPVFPFTGLSTPAYREFDAVWKRYGGGKAVAPASALGWASAKLFEKVAKAAGGDISRESLLKQLRGVKGERLGGLTAPMTFGPKGAVDTNCVFFMRGNNGKWAAPNGDKPFCW